MGELRGEKTLALVPDIIRLYPARGLEIIRGSAQYVWDSRGAKYLDFHTGHGVAFLGHNNPLVVGEIKKQLDEIIVLSPAFDTPARRKALEAIGSIIPPGLDAVYLLNSGAEAVEMALKIARLYTGKEKIVSFKGGFHGRTAGALSVTWNPRYRAALGLEIPGVVFGEINNAESLDLINDDTAAVIIEPVQGEAGIIPVEPWFLKSLEKACRKNKCLLLIDEIQSGFGRTGRLWAYLESGVEPDILLAGKSIGGGIPVSVVMTKKKYVEELPSGWHGSTYGFNPLASIAVYAGIKAYHEDDAEKKARERGKEIHDVLTDKLRNNALVRDIRVRGLMIGVELRKTPGRALRCLQEHRVLALKAGATTVRFLPPYMISSNDIDWSVSALRDCLQ